MSESQSFAKHAKMVPAYHYVTFLLILVPLIWFGYVAVTGFSVGGLMMFLFAVGVMMATFYARVFPLGVQDRVIRLEERLRMQQVLPDDLKGRIMEVRTDHIIGLRFAPDEELPDLVRKVLAGELADRKSIKAAIRNWRADNQRI